MLKIRPLNRDSLSDEDAPTIRKEAQEEIALDLYNKALKLENDGDVDKAEETFNELLEKNIPQLESQGGLPKTMSTLKYSCYINLGTISNQRQQLKEALDHYLKASELDGTDVSLWYKIGVLALKQDKFRRAIFAFSKGLDCSETHWPCLDQLIVLLFSVRDNLGCLYYITKALLVDPEYTRGLVLRREIYAGNSATREYYQLCNPDHVYEPDLDVEIEEVDVRLCLQDCDELCDRINAAERALGPKPLPCIPLPVPLEDFTWLHLGKTITGLHKYISDNDMTHFCKVNLSKCMSQNVESESMILENVDVIKENLTKPDLKKSDVQETEELNVETEKNVERRLSQASELNDSAIENMGGSQTEDNDEMDQDTEDQDDNGEQKTDKKRNFKRKRDLLSDLQIWGWHSKRKYQKKGKSEKDLTIDDAIKRIIPTHLLPNNLNNIRLPSAEDSIDTMDIYNQFIEREPATVCCLSPMSTSNTAIPSITYFGSQQEKEDVLKFWKKERICCDAVTLIKEFVHAIAELWSHQWPQELKEIYVQAYGMFREHFDHPQLFQNSVEFEELRNDALPTLLWGELLHFQESREIKPDEGIHPTSLVQLQLLSGWDNKWGDEFLSFHLRVYWLRMHFYRKCGENSLAISALNMIRHEIQEEETRTGEKFCLRLPNCSRYSLITSDIAEKFLKHLAMINSLSQLQHLFSNKSYVEVANILKSTFHYPGSNLTCGQINRPAQLGMLMHSLWYLNLEECFVWTEECLNEAVGYLGKKGKDRDKWEMVLNKCIAILYEIIKKETVCVVDKVAVSKRIRLVENLCSIVRYQLNLENATSIPLGSVLPWLVLHYVLLRDEHREQAKRKVSHIHKKQTEEDVELSDEEKEVPSSIAILFSAHEFLGRRGWCLTNQGELLHFIVDRILDRLDTPIFEHLREKIDIHLEQAFFCLYQHPSKKNKVSRHLADHNVNPLPLTWERAEQLYEFFCPDRLPEFDSFKSISISADLELLLQRLIALIPSEYDVQSRVPKIQSFVNGNTEELLEPVKFPTKTRAIYYLLGDFYFKQNEVQKSIKYFLLDLCINPWRSDTWADLALGFASQLETKLNHCERFKTESEFFDKAKSAQTCFRQALKNVNDHLTLWIEFGAFEYMLHSFSSRIIKYESESFSMEKFETLENQKESYLNGSGASFTRALDLYQPDQAEADERWLHHYMLGKVAEKKRQEPVDYLQHYLTAGALLNENKAVYPDKINYYNPQHLSVEALEIHYRIHASIIKYLELHESKNIPSGVGKVFKKSMDSAKMYETTAKQIENAASAKTNAQDPVKNSRPQQENSNENIRIEVLKCLEDLIRQVELKEKKDVDEVIVISEDVEDCPKPAPSESVIKPVKDIDAQKIMDNLMQQTMKNQDVIEIDSSGNEASFKSKETTNFKEMAKCNRVESLKKEDGQFSIRKSLDGTTTSTSSDSSSSDSDSDDSSSSSSATSSSENTSEFLSHSEIEAIVDRCIEGLEQCVLRFPQNYKALYRLAHFYFHYKPKKDLAKSRQLLLGEYKCKRGSNVTGLFNDRKTTNFFNGVWRIPSSEIDRPGSLAAHMSRCVALLLQVLCASKDNQKLLDVCLQLRKTPDPNKIYIRHAEREQLAEQALSLCVQSIREQIKSMTTSSKSSMQKVVLDLFRAYQRVQKHLPHKENTFASMFGEAYKKFMQDKIPENANVLDLANKFCQQLKSAEKLKQQPPKPVIVQPSSTLQPPPPPVLPTPYTPTTTNPTIPLKRPTLGRPRGRPPGPSKSPRAARTNNPNYSSWQNMMSYMMTYQEQLLRQYSTISQMNQLNALASQLAKSTTTHPLLNSPQMLQAFSQMNNSGLNPLGVKQMPQGISNLQTNPMKKTEQNSRPRGFTPSTTSYGFGSSTKHTTAVKTSATTAVRPSPATVIRPNATSTPIKTVPSSSFKCPTSTVVKTKHLDIPAKSGMSIIRNVPSTVSVGQDYVKATSMLGGRPNISITPVMPASAEPSTSMASGKTLQEKLADKQKQFGNRATLDAISKSPLNLPQFLPKSGISISQVSAGNKSVEITSERSSKKIPQATVQPISVSVIKTSTQQKRKNSSDDDVICID